ncbi:SurA N-terminal domain-containing protein [Blattabacterium cuenoti]|uniref:SurA N-terminal domain-containing protein n=1 Tax=Blattabacterium cuenoti TaxID=1653831 RepID=UPI00163B8F70|nr:SurA N-terminal domain-containing protein [Blattabacterium cuenoti]
MSCLEKIRRNTWLIFLFLGIFLVFFILDPNILLKLFSKNTNLVGKVNEDGISYKEYLEYYQFLKKFREKEPENYLRNDAWKFLVHEKILLQQADKLGIKSTEKDFWNAIEKQSIYSKIPDFQYENGKMNLLKFKSYLKNLKKVSKNNTNPQIEEERKIWDYEKKNILKKIVAKKYVEMLMYGLNTSLTEAELNYKDKNHFSIIDYIFIPYSEIKEKYKSVKNSELYDFIKKNKFLYKKEDLRSISFVILRSLPSSEDEKNMEFKINKLFKQLKLSKDHSMIVSSQSEKPLDSNFYLKKNLPPVLQYFLERENKIGSMFGPLKENNIYIIAKLTGKKMIYNSVLSSQILISHKEAEPRLNQRTKKEAENLAKKIYNMIKENPYKFNSLMEKSDDFINAKKNKGNLGWIKYKERNNILKKLNIFSSKHKKGDIIFSETKFGYHILRIDGQKDLEPVYQFSIIVKTLFPSKKTDNLLYKNAIQFINKNKNSNLNTFINNARKKKYETIFLETVKKNQWDIPGLNTDLDRKVINWSYDKNKKEGDKKVFYTSKGDYIIARLSSIQKKGYPIEEIKNELIPVLVRKKIESNLFRIINNNHKYSKSLETLSKYFSKKINKYCEINFYNSMIGEYKEPKVVGYIFSSKLHKTSKPLLGNKGIFFVRTLKRFNTFKNPSYFYSEIEILNSFLRKNFLEILGDVLIRKSKIEDFRKDV